MARSDSSRVRWVPKVLGKKARQISVLHVWHHGSIVPLFSFYLSTGRGGGFIAALPLWNSLIHVVRAAAGYHRDTSAPGGVTLLNSIALSHSRERQSVCVSVCLCVCVSVCPMPHAHVGAHVGVAGSR